MEREKLEGLLSKKDQSVEKPSEENPYSQDDLSKFINDVGYAVDGTPKLSELAKLMNRQNNPLDTKQEVKDNKNPLSIVRKHLSAEKPQIDGQDKQLSIEALKKLIAKYKGE